MADKIEDVIFYAIDHLYRKKQQFAAKQFAEKGIDITPEQWVILKIADQYDGILQVTLAEKAAKDTASVTRMLDILQKKELVERRPSAEDRRAFAIHLTAKGKKLVKQNLDFVVSLRKEAVKGITKAELETLKTALKKMEENMI